MAYGISVKNNNNETVIDGESRMLSVLSTFSYAHTLLDSGVYVFDRVDDIGTDHEIVLFKPPVGHWVAPMSLHRISSTLKNVITSSATPLVGARVRFTDRIAAPTGYGGVIYNEDGQRIWSSQHPLVAITDGGFRAQGSGYTTYTKVMAGNAGVVRGGPINISFGSESCSTWRIARTAEDSVRVEYNRVTAKSGNSSPTAVYEGGMTMLAARLA